MVRKEPKSKMVTPTGFHSWSNFFHFALARKFAPRDPHQPVTISRNVLENVGHVISRPILTPLNFMLREIKNPLVILALTVTLVALATILFYPAQFMMVASTVFPFLVKIQPWMVKLALFAAVETTILALGVRALGRMCNRELRQAWHARKLLPIHLGARLIS